MAITRKGQTGWIFSSNGALQTDRFGLSSATARWRRLDLSTAANPGSPIAFGNAHPLWTFLTCDKVTISDSDNGWDCEASFFGVNGSPDPIYEIDLSTSEEPIETHPDFDTLAGEPGLEYNGAKFDADGAFIGFTDRAYPDFSGVRGYLAPGAVWRKNYVTSTRPSDFGSVGSIDTPEGSPPTIPSGRNWLYTGLTWEQRGLTYQVRKEWRLSGPQGWNVLIYP